MNVLEDVFKFLDWSGCGININGEYIIYFCFVDDIVVMVELLEELNIMFSDFNIVF